MSNYRHERRNRNSSHGIFEVCRTTAVCLHPALLSSPGTCRPRGCRTPHMSQTKHVKTYMHRLKVESETNKPRLHSLSFLPTLPGPFHANPPFLAFNQLQNLAIRNDPPSWFNWLTPSTTLYKPLHPYPNVTLSTSCTPYFLPPQ